MHNFMSEHYITENKDPVGGYADGMGFTINWQRGPVKFNDQKEPLPNGAFVYDVVAAALDRLQFFQQTKYKSEDHKKAIKYLGKALTHLTVKM